MATLNVTSGSAAGRSFEVDRELIIGRGDDADLRLDDAEVSRRHAAVRPIGTGVGVRDLGSQNGTTVNGELVRDEVTLTASGTIRVGETDLAVEILELKPTVVSETPTIEPTVVEQRPAPTAPARQETAAGVPAHEPPVHGPGRPEPPPPRYGGPSEAGGRRPSRRLTLLATGIVLAVAAAVVLVIVLSGDSTETQEFTASGTTGLLSIQGSDLAAGGTMEVTPGGEGAIVIELSGQGDLQSTEPVPITGTVVLWLEGGQIETDLEGESIRRPNGTSEVTGSGTITGGSGDFEGATGTFDFTAGPEDPNQPTIGHPMMTGEITF